ncbi:group III truncated hemoglobin [Polaribacter sp. P097]|uniref:group III truncated hemoglobin n=1 Tax=Polaribacter sp. P097 TaxID=3117398 RepID=UPI002FDF4856
MTPDISSKADIHFIITSFYKKLLSDASISPFFKEIVTENQLDVHLEFITNFWNDILFDTLSYQENVMQKHLKSNAKMAFKKSHFDIWISYFFEVIDANFNGAKASLMKNRASSIATVMKLKMNMYK